MFKLSEKLKFMGTLFFIVVGAMLFSIDDSFGPSFAGATCPESSCPSGEVCCGGVCIDAATTGCCDGEEYDLETQCCSP